MMQADYVVVGAGSGGCAVAYRLAEAGHSVIVVEAGGSDAGPFIQMPGALSYPMNMARYDWGYQTEPEPHLGGRRLACPRGRVLGGSSSINGMVYGARPCARLRSLGRSGRGWLAFCRCAALFSPDGELAGGRKPVARAGRAVACVARQARKTRCFDAFVEAGRQAGYPVTEDYNGAQQEGFGAMEATIHRGQRWSAARAYLRPAMATGRVRVVRGLAAQVLFDAANRATGVAFAGWTDHPCARRGGAGRKQYKHTAAFDVVGHWPRRASGRTWDQTAR